MSWADIQAMQALVQQVTVLASSTFVTLTPALTTGQPPRAYPYAIIHPTGGVDEQARFTGPYTTEHPEFTIHLVGGTANQVQVLTDLLKGVVKPSGLGIIPTVSGRRNQRMFWRQPIPIQTNTEVTPPMVYAVVETGWTSEPA
jgi:hypothetical protein